MPRPAPRPPKAEAASARIARLKEAGLLVASPARQRAFWACQNRKSRRRVPTALGATLAEMLDAGFGRTLRHAARINELLAAVLPPHLAAGVEVGALHRGTLTLHLPTGAQAYDLDRTFAAALLQACTEAAPELRILRIRCAVGGRPV